VKRRRDNFPLKPLVISAAIVISLIALAGYLRKVLTTSNYFNVSDIISKEQLNGNLDYLKGKNIFTLDLRKESLNISAKCPDCLKVRVARILPDRLFVEFIRREPVALVKLYRYFVVDQYGVFFGSMPNPGNLDLPLVTGLETKLFGVTLGRRYVTKELALVLNIIKEFNNSSSLKGYSIKRIDVGTADDVSLFIPLNLNKEAYAQWQPSARENILEVRISQGNILEKIAVISGLINQEKHNLANIKYIDYRFKEPVIKFKDAK